ncbi:SAM4 [Candida oxycetoniae]|uniref:SAM4 n=1 Tax=Candida oxycetoniae TaxID=497107 RepID=A0AAI9T0X0_9ASCO|nr:SAM4 [Candida oxycetoniae]KAI3406838.2 SAM4 [Candida oxycetoniae]
MPKDIFGKRRVIDGALGTELEELIDPNETFLPSKSPLWSGQALIDAPQVVKAVHKEYMKAGADIVLTSTYQSSYQSLKKHTEMTNEQIHELWQRAIDIVKESRSELGKTDSVFIAGSIGPYAAYLADGSEYTGKYSNISLSKVLREFYQPLLEFFVNNDDIDLIIFETIPNFHEFQIANELASEYSDKKPFVVSFTCQNNHSLTDGTALSTMRKYLTETTASKTTSKVLGLNCVDYEVALSIIDQFPEFKFFVYPNLGFQYDATCHQFIIKKGRPEDAWDQFIRKLVSYRNVIGIGGCCNTGTKEIKFVRSILDEDTIE